MWAHNYGGTGPDYGYALRQTADGGYIVAGHTFSFGTANGDMYLIKLTGSGTVAWSETFGGFDSEAARAVVQCTDGGYAMAGNTNSFGAGGVDGILVKYDGAGNCLWDQTYGVAANDEFLYALAQTADGGFILTGASCADDYETSDMFLVKTDAFGNETWSRTIDYNGVEYATDVVVAAGGGYALAGVRTLYELSGDEVVSFTATMCLVKTNASGVPQWLEEYGEYAGGFALQQTGDGGYILAGQCRAWSPDPLEEPMGFAVKTDASGAEEWSREYEYRAGFCGLYDGQETSDGGYIFAGQRGSAALLLKTDDTGAETWSRAYGSGRTSTAEALSVVENAAGGFCFAGAQFLGAADDWSVYVVKTNEMGAIRSLP